jgi:hypothetical protein
MVLRPVRPVLGALELLVRALMVPGQLRQSQAHSSRSWELLRSQEGPHCSQDLTSTCCLPREPVASHEHPLPPTRTCCLPRVPAASYENLLPTRTCCPHETCSKKYPRHPTAGCYISHTHTRKVRKEARLGFHEAYANMATTEVDS